MNATTLDKPTTAKQPTHNGAIGSVVLGIVGITVAFGFTSPFAYLKGRRAVTEIDAAPGQYSGRALAVGGQVLGVIGTVYLALWLIIGFTAGIGDVELTGVFRTALNQAFGPNAIVYALAAIGLNVHFGYTGLLNFGQAGFMAVGAYGLAVTVVTWELPFWLGVAMALVAPVVLAIVLGLPTLRLRADYLAIATIATAEILRLVFGAVETREVFGGSNGLTNFAGDYQSLNPYSERLDLGIVSFSARDLWSMTVGWTLVLVSCLIVWALMRSPWGRVLRSIREDEDAVRSLGKNVFAYKMQALILGGVFGGLAGLFLALKQASVVPSDYSTNMTFLAFTALLIGGAARVFGPVIGAMILWFLIAGLGDFFDRATSGSSPLMPDWIMDNTQASLVRFIATGLGLMLLMIFRPQGIFGDRREIAIDGR
ncbi:branched-chain amino acid ABC transporter permease [Nocardioides zeae]|uniref:Branched-chain amino acid ABC transporter permease n=1 Tax=Nocardioides imazamoxiresistens TaxID=3231893 RepID=A0ABU3PZ49_9ACTN|nr:branched-chain amino acid ABC transporter permease [Nocardioides zeae]MDT9594545.1 branched-chain amino acid ABC transporter permease [Nocardioides zeae]